MGFSFYLKKKKDKKDSFIWISYRYDKQRLQYSTGIKIENLFWNDTRKKVKRTAKGKTFEQAMETNNRLNAIEETTEKVYNELKATHGSINNELFKTALDEKIKGIKPTSTEPQKITFFEFIDQFIKNSRATKSQGTVKHYEGLKKHLLEFGRKWKPKNPTFDFKDIDLEFYYDFVQYLNDKGQKPNSVGKKIALLKAVLNDSVDRGLNDNVKFRSKKFKVLREQVMSIYLTEPEIQRIYDLDLSEYSKGYHTTRDLFVIGCYTGLRFSDFTRLKKENIRDGKIYIQTQKTGKEVVIPIHTYVNEIFEKYKWTLPRPLANQAMNRYLKEIAEFAQIVEPIAMTVQKGTLKTDITRPKFELVKTHTARRSFATNAYKAGLNVLAIRKITGHKDDLSFYTYIKVDNEENANDLVNDPFFKKTERKLKAV